MRVRDLIEALKKEDPEAVVMTYGPSPGEETLVWHEARSVSRGTTSNTRDDWRRDADVERQPSRYKALPHGAIVVR
jgi:hypothetical protein